MTMTTTRTRIPTTDLTGRALDYAVALAENLEFHTVWQPQWDDWGRTDWFYDPHEGRVTLQEFDGSCSLAGAWRTRSHWSPSTDPEYGQPIIEREGISTRAIRRPGHPSDGQWLAMPNRGDTGQNVQWVEFLFGDQEQRRLWRGPTMLVAGMRCHVASKLGNHVDVPKELLS